MTVHPYQPAVVELDCGGVLTDVDRCGGEGGDVIRDPLASHPREGVVH